MKLIKNFLEKTKNKPDIWIFYIFLLTLPLSIRKIFSFFPLNENNPKIFNEYTGIFLYLSDILIFFVIFFWIIFKLYNKNINLSIINTLPPKKLWITCVNKFKKVNLKQIRSFLNKYSNRLVGKQTQNDWKDYLIIAPFLLIFWSFVSIIWSENQIIAFFRSIKILEFFLLYLFIKNKLFPVEQLGKNNQDCSPWNIKRNIIKIFIFWGSIQSIIAIWQFIAQKSLGLRFLQESIINPEILGVAKIIIGNEKYIRAYGLFPHPNILGGFLLLSIILTIFYKKMFPVEHLKTKKYFFHSLIVKKIKKFTDNVPRGTFISILLFVQIIALLLTFSKSAIIGLFIALIYVFIQFSKLDISNVSHGTMFPVEQIKKLRYYFLLSLTIFGILLFYFKVDLYSLFIQSLEERFIYLTTSVQAISQNLLWGLGQGQFVLEMKNYSLQNLTFWQYQPVHNVFLLILSELGMIGLFFFIWFLLELFHPNQNVPCGTSNETNIKQLKTCHSDLRAGISWIPDQVRDNNERWKIYFKSILLGFIFIMLFDHYFWDIQQGSLMLWIVMGLISVKE